MLPYIRPLTSGAHSCSWRVGVVSSLLETAARRTPAMGTRDTVGWKPPGYERLLAICHELHYPHYLGAVRRAASGWRDSVDFSFFRKRPGSDVEERGSPEHSNFRLSVLRALETCVSRRSFNCNFCGASACVTQRQRVRRKGLSK